MAANRYLSWKDIPPNLYIAESEIVMDNSRPISAGFSDVYRGHFAGRPNEAVAIKRLRYTGEDDDGNSRMDRALEKEITALMRIRHPFILSFLGLVILNYDPCIVTPWAEKGTVRKYLKGNPTADREKIVREVAAALEHLHSGNALRDGTVIVHGDIHSNNVLIGSDGSALLCDFGICKLIPPGQMASLSLRTAGPQGMVAYVAPELHSNDTLRSVKSDVFSFGMLIYDVLGGELSKLGPTSASIVMKLQVGIRPGRVDGMRDELWQIACDCWENLPENRPTMQNVYSRLQVV
ncbi:kinase-like protein [Auricularia subglabra TFB-10046 SS5]|nr:kinase-like protein [Auricularia subglabra TFB-10046 SS5]